LVGKDEQGRFNTDVLSAAYFSSAIHTTALQRLKHMYTPKGMVLYFVRSVQLNGRVKLDSFLCSLLCTVGSNVVTLMTTADVELSFASSCLQFVLLSARSFTFVVYFYLSLHIFVLVPLFSLTYMSCVALDCVNDVRLANHSTMMHNLYAWRFL
jgi:hypothetical protein